MSELGSFARSERRRMNRELRENCKELKMELFGLNVGSQG